MRIADPLAGFGGTGMIRCRPVTEDDEPFLRRLIVSVVSAELAAWAWPDALREQLLEMQYRIRRQGIETHYPGSEVSVIEFAGAGSDTQPVGWLVVSRTDADMHIVEIAILAEWRGRGIGTTVLRGLLDESDRRGETARLNVNIGNPAVVLYERLGFRRTAGTEVQHYMVREPNFSAEKLPAER